MLNPFPLRWCKRSLYSGVHVRFTVVYTVAQLWSTYTPYYIGYTFALLWSTHLTYYSVHVRLTVV